MARGGMERREGGTRVFDPRRHERRDSADAFIPDPLDGPAPADDDLAEVLAEDFVRGATSGENPEEHGGDLVDEEFGGPFIETYAAEEFAVDQDPTLPRDAAREALPRAVAALVQPSPDEGAMTDDEANDASDEDARQRETD